jgi:putative transposase
MKLARSTYYYRSRRAAAREKALRERIVALRDEFPRYGYRRVTHQLRAEGMSSIIRSLPASCAKMACRCGLYAASCGPLTAITRIRSSLIFPNLAANLVPDGPN